ncbi:MAG: hypothetical protein ACTSU7_07185 [Candidatus Heimdallarchaeaceae archaeon]
MLKNRKEKRWGSSGEIPKSEIIKEVFKVGGKVFLFTSTIPLIHTLIFIFAVVIPLSLDPSVSERVYNYRIRTNLFYVIADWLFVVLPFVIPAMVGKRLLFTKYREKTKLMPVMTGGLCLLIGIAVAIWFLFGGVL